MSAVAIYVSLIVLAIFLMGWVIGRHFLWAKVEREVSSLVKEAQAMKERLEHPPFAKPIKLEPRDFRP